MPLPLTRPFRHSGRPRNQSGFALLITITLLAFLVLLLVSLASLTRVETQVAGNNQQLSQARQNALGALNIALGQLQKAAGPDQRATATADLTNASPSVGTARWTGVWGNSLPSSNYSQTTALLNWLVSGNENSVITADTTATANFGSITSAVTDPSYIPTHTISPAVGPTTKPTDNIQIRNQPGRMLVGPGTLGTDSAPETLAKYVVAPLQNISVPASTIPGLSGSTATIIGRYAYWVGDEGVKAKVNLVDPYAASTATTEQKRFRYQAAQRTGTELIDNDNNSGNANAFTPLYAAVANTDPVRKLVDPAQLPLLSTASADQTTLLNTRRNRFHDLTTYSAGVLADQAKGGLRRDLTAAFSINNPGGTTLGSGGTLQDFLDTRIFDPATSNAYDFGGVTWSRLRDYYRLNPSGATSIAPQSPANATDLVISPVISVVQLYVGGSMSADTSATPDPTKMTVTYHLTPVVVLWNPYNVTIRATDYRLTGTGDVNNDWNYRKDRSATLVLQYLKNGDYLPSNAYYRSNRPKRFSLFHVGMNLTSGVDIPPGQAVVYTMKSDVALGDIYATSSPINLNLTPGWFPGAQVKYATYTQDIVGAPDVTGADAGAATNLYVGFGDGGPVASSAFNTWAFQLSDASNPGRILQAVGGLNGFVSSLGSSASPPRITIPNWSNDISGIDRPIAGFKYVLNVTDGGIAGLATVSNSGRRWLANYNPRSYLSARSPSDSAASGTTGFNNNPSYNAYISSASYAPIGAYFDTGISSAVKVGYSVDSASGGEKAALFSIPTDAVSANDYSPRFVSLGALRMADFYRNDGRVTTPNPATLAPATLVATYPYTAASVDNSETWNISNFSPAYPFGASLADPRISPDRVFRSYTSTETRRFGHISYDTSYLLNRAIWDGYFLSTVSQVTAPDFTAAGFNLPNSRLQPYGTTTAADLQSFEKAASRLVINGAFNVNSTSVEAWTALLASLRNVDVGTYSDANKTFYPREATPANPPFNASTQQADSEAAYTGFRSLNDAQIRTLAGKIVAEVRARGPFLSLAQFINRSLVANDYRGLKGALQAAIDSTDINASLLAPTVTRNRHDLNAALVSSSHYLLDGGGFNSGNPAFYVRASNTAGRIVGFEDRGSQTAAAASDANSAGGGSYAHSAPGFLTQGDLLTSLAPVLSARSDTFRIRIYAEAVNPLDDTIVLSRAWCEAIVQRTPDYVDSADLPETRPVNLTSDANKTFGRKFKIVSLRWLTPEEI